MKRTTAKTKGKLKRGNPTSPFSAENQPSPEAKKAGRERRRQAQKMMDMILKHQDMTREEFTQYLLEKKESGELTLLEEIIAKYTEGALASNKMLVDLINRHVPYAPQKTELSGEDGGPIKAGVVLLPPIDEK